MSIYTNHLPHRPSAWYHKYQQADSHVDKWRELKIVVKRNCNGVFDSYYTAIYNGYTGFGRTSEEAIEDLKITMDGD